MDSGRSGERSRWSRNFEPPSGGSGELALLEPVVAGGELVSTEDGDLVTTFTGGYIVPGEIGGAGEQGPPGPPGVQGEPGEKGPAGDKGIAGDPGPGGDKGPTGDQGPVGTAGAPGEKGPADEAGADGEPGADGQPGPPGDKGALGDKGPAGDKGLTGDKGLVGDKGATGDKGPVGDKGTQGDPGVGGLSAPGYISGADLEWVSTSSVRLTPGSAMVNGTLLSWTANLSLTGISGSANTIRYVYLYDNNGTPALLQNTTAPVYSASLDYWQMTGASSRRCVGFVRLNGSGALYNFVQTSFGRTREQHVILGSGDTIAAAVIVQGATNTASWAPYSLSSLVPVHATHYFLAAKLAYTATGQDGTVGVSPVVVGASGGAGAAPYTVRDSNGNSGSVTFFGRAWLPIVEAQTTYGRLAQNAGTPSYILECHGARFSV